MPITSGKEVTHEEEDHHRTAGGGDRRRRLLDDRPDGPALSSLGLNYTDCASNGFGATLCGDDLKRYERAVKGSDNKGADVEAKSTAVTAAEAMETCATDNDGSYAGCTRAELESIEPTLTDARLDVDAKTASYDIVVTSARSDDVVFVLQRLSDGTPRRTCDTGSEPNGGCPADGWW